MNKVCSINGCQRKYYAKGWCNMHWSRWYRQGDPEKRLTKQTKAGEASKYLYEQLERKTDECFTWPYSVNFGYGLIRYKNKQTNTHRVALLIKVGKAPLNKPLALHKCRSRQCFNPKHLYWGDYKDNARDRIKDGTHLLGEKHHRSKLTEAQVQRIRTDTRTLPIIANELGVEPSTISLIKRRVTWAWLE